MKIKVEDNRKKLLRDLEPGTVFEYYNKIYLKTDSMHDGDPDRCVACVYIERGEVSGILSNATVIPIRAKFVLE